MENMSVAFTPDTKKLTLKVFMNLKDEHGELNTEDYLLFTKELVIPEEIWNLIVEIDEA